MNCHGSFYEWIVTITTPIAGTGDLDAVYEELLKNYGKDTKFVGVGYSLGACVLVKFLGQKKSRQDRFICAMSIGQGYDPWE